MFGRQFKRLSHFSSANKITIPYIYELVAQNQRFVTLTAHDAFSARLAEEAGVDVILVGDSLAMVSQGMENTNEITLSEMIYHSKSVKRGAKRSLLMGDLPFGSYERGADHAMQSALELVKRGHIEIVKMEGGRELCSTVLKLKQYGIACCPHIGLNPQRQISTGGFKVQGRSAKSAFDVVNDAIELEKAGATMLLVEGVPAKVGLAIKNSVKIPLIGIGAGPHTDSQVLVQLDMLGGFENTPKFVKKYADLRNVCLDAISNYAKDVREGSFPLKEHSYMMKSEEYKEFMDRVKNEN